MVIDSPQADTPGAAAETPPGEPIPGLLPAHLADLRGSGLSDDTIRAAGLYSESDPATLAKLLNKSTRKARELGPCLVFPYFESDGGTRAEYVQVKPAHPPKGKDGKSRRYLSAWGVPTRVYVPPGTRAKLADPTVPLVITEGVKKALKADQEGFACLGLVGVSCWSAPRPKAAGGKKSGRRELHPDLRGIPWAGRLVHVTFDSDAATKSQVLTEEQQFAAELRRGGAKAGWVRLPPKSNGEKAGLDDFLDENGADALRELIAAAAPADGDPPPRDFGAAMFRDPDRLAALAALSLSSPDLFAAERAALKRQGVSLRDLDKALAPPRRSPAGGQAVRDRRRPADRTAPVCHPTRPHLPFRSNPGRPGRGPALQLHGRRRRGRGRGRRGRMPPVLACGRAPGHGQAAPGGRSPGRAVRRDGLAVGRVGDAGRRVRRAGHPRPPPHRRPTAFRHGPPGDDVHPHRVAGGRRAVVLPARRGAIDAGGPAAGVRVRLPPPIAGYILPDPPSGDALRRAVRASLGVLGVGGGERLAPDEVVFPVALATYRAPLGGADFSVGLFGATGAGKSELAALAQQHYGAGMDARHLPGNWASTANALEAQAFLAKDALFVADDYCPDAADPHRLRQTADRLVRGQGNGAGRNRMTADAGLRPVKPPRGLTVLTGEDVPGGRSLRARVWAVDVAAGAVNFARLSVCQREAAAGLYAQALAGFVRWLAADYPARRDRHQADVARLRDELTGAGGHARVPTTAADLLAALDLVLAFAQEVRAVDVNEAAALRARGTAALRATAAAQTDFQLDADPAERFPVLVQSALTSGRAHLAARDGTRPAEAFGTGWRRTDAGSGSWEGLGRRIGWVTGERVYLDPDASLAEAVRLAGEQGNPFITTPRTLWKRLHEAGLLAEVDTRDGRTRFSVRRSVKGQQRMVIVFDAAAILLRGSGQCGHSGDSPEESADPGVATPRANGHPGASNGVASSGEYGHEARPEWPGANPNRNRAIDDSGHNGHSDAVYDRAERDGIHDFGGVIPHAVAEGERPAPGEGANDHPRPD